MNRLCQALLAITLSCSAIAASAAPQAYDQGRLFVNDAALSFSLGEGPAGPDWYTLAWREADSGQRSHEQWKPSRPRVIHAGLDLVCPEFVP